MTTEAEVAPATVEAVVPSPDAPADAKVDKAETDAKAESKDAPKEVPKPDQPRLPKPDRAALDASIAELQEAADVQQARIETLKRAIESRREKRKNITSGSQETRARIGELNAAFSAHMVRPVPSRDATVVPQLSRAPDPPDLRNPRGPAILPFGTAAPDRSRARAPPRRRRRRRDRHLRDRPRLSRSPRARSPRRVPRRPRDRPTTLRLPSAEGRPFTGKHPRRAGGKAGSARASSSANIFFPRVTTESPSSTRTETRTLVRSPPPPSTISPTDLTRSSTLRPHRRSATPSARSSSRSTPFASALGNRCWP